MSGGSFEYACFKLNSGGWEVIQTLPNLCDMEQYLRTMGKIEAADEIKEGIKQIEEAKTKLSAIGEHLYELAYATEWWCSGDWGEGQFDKEFENKYAKNI